MNCPCCGQALREDGEFRFDDAGIVINQGRVTTLTQQETVVFATLHAARGLPVSKQQLIAALYPIEADEADIKIVDVFVCKIRKKLKPLRLDIGTVWGRGYRFISPTGKAVS